MSVVESYRAAVETRESLRQPAEEARKAAHTARKAWIKAVEDTRGPTAAEQSAVIAMGSAMRDLQARRSELLAIESLTDAEASEFADIKSELGE